MASLTAALIAYGITIAFALVIAVIIQGLGSAIKRLRLDRDEEPANLEVPSSNSLKEEEAVAVAVAVAFSKRE